MEVNNPDDQFQMDTSSSLMSTEGPSSSRPSPMAHDTRNGVRLKRVHFEQSLPHLHLPSSSSSMSPMSPTNSYDSSANEFIGHSSSFPQHVDPTLTLPSPTPSSSFDSFVEPALITSIPIPISKEWQQSVSTILRDQLVSKLLCTSLDRLGLNQHPISLQDPRMSKVVNYFRNMEKDMYDKANSRSEYYHAVAERIYNSLKGLDHEKQRRLEFQQQEMSNLVDSLIRDTSEMTISFEH